jgi:GT2 family glycosyltransferase
MLVTCICVCHDKPEFAHEAIQSIIDQSYPHWEALIIDSGVSYDRGYYDRFAWRHDPRVRLIRSDETPELRRGKAMAPWCFNECFRKGLVRGELVMYLCDDDILYPKAFETFVAHAKQHPEHKAMYASQDIGIVRPDGTRTICGERRATRIGGRCVNGRRMDCEVDYLQFCHRREVIGLLDGDEYWPEAKDTESHADGIFMERFGEHVPIYPIDIKVSQNRRTTQSLNDPVDPGCTGGQDSENYRSLRKEIARWRAEAESWRQQYVLNRSFVHSLSRSLPWKLLKPFRALRRILRPRGFDSHALIPWRQIERDEDNGGWVTTGTRPCFLVPCELPAGRYRLNVSLVGDVAGRFEIIARAGDGIADVESVFHAEMKEVFKEDRIIQLSRPALGVQINPPGAAGKFEIKQLELHPLGLRSLWTKKRREGWVESSRPTRVYSTLTSPQRKQGAISVGLEESTHPTRMIEYPDLGLGNAPSVDWSIVIPTVNGVDRVRNCISSCLRHIEPGVTTEFIVVDDGTPNPHTVRKLKQLSTELGFQLRRNHQNLGFSASVNHGMRNARGRSILLCNNDIVFRQPVLNALASAFKAEPRTGIVGCKLIYPDNAVQYAGMDKVPGELRWTHAGHGLPADHSTVCHGRFVWSVTGALCAFRRETLQRLGGLSTAYGFAYEDLDYCLRAWSHGVRVYYCPGAVAIHEESETLGKTRRQRKRRPLIWSERERSGRRYFEKKWRRLHDIESFEQLANRKLGEASENALSLRHSFPEH